VVSRIVSVFREVVQTITVVEILEVVRIRAVQLLVTVTTIVSRVVSVTRELILIPYIIERLVVEVPVRIWWALTAPLYELFEWALRRENIMFIFGVIGLVTIVSTAWVWAHRKELFRPAVLRYLEGKRGGRH